MKAGVLALQGAFREHREVLEALDVHVVEVRTPEQLASIDALLLPGGESTTMTRLLATSGLREPLVERIAASEQITDEDVVTLVLEAADAQYRGKVELVGSEAFAGFERSVLLQVIDQHWREHLAMLDHLRQGIHLRGYAQKNPKQEYKR